MTKDKAIGPTTLTYVGLRVQDMERALRFYAALGLRLQKRDKIQETGGEVAYVATHEGGPRLELNWYPPRSEHAVPYVAGEALDHLGVAIDGDVREAVEALVAAGGRMRHEGPIHGLVYVDSPDGHTVELWKA